MAKRGRPKPKAHRPQSIGDAVTGFFDARVRRLTANLKASEARAAKLERENDLLRIRLGELPRASHAGEQAEMAE